MYPHDGIVILVVRALERLMLVATAVLAIHRLPMIIMKLAGFLSLRQWACTVHTDEFAFCTYLYACVVRKFVYRDIDIGMMLRASDMFCTYS